MSELKWNWGYLPYLDPPEKQKESALKVGYIKVVDKAEADKVIAEKDAKILALDAEVFKQKHHAKLFFDERNYAETQLRKQKFKRCLDKAKWCDERIARYTLQQEIQGISWQKEIKFYRRLKDKFIEISKRFEAPKLEGSND